MVDGILQMRKLFPLFSLGLLYRFRETLCPKVTIPTSVRVKTFQTPRVGSRGERTHWSWTLPPCA